MVIYVDKMPKNCDRCPLIDKDSDFPNYFCNADNHLLDNFDGDNERHIDCPLKLIAEHDSEKDLEIKKLKKQVERSHENQTQLVAGYTAYRKNVEIELKNSIIPKHKVGDKIWVRDNYGTKERGKIFQMTLKGISVIYKVDEWADLIYISDADILTDEQVPEEFKKLKDK